MCGNIKVVARGSLKCLKFKYKVNYKVLIIFKKILNLGLENRNFDRA